VLPGKPPRVVMYDFGQACSLKSDQAQGILDVIEAIIDMDSNRCVDAFVKMGVMKEGADMAKVRAKVQNNFETGKIQVKRKKLKKAGYIFKNSGDVEITSTLVKGNGNGNDGEVMSFFTLPSEYAFVARAIAQMDGVGKALDPEFDFISSAAPHIVEIKGTTSYVSDELNKWIRNTSRKIIDWQQSLGAE
jgi:predicted unusual protein kinase regulating ubiquinone biosynthesis (AarF/ABC1/UbiB family)